MTISQISGERSPGARPRSDVAVEALRATRRVDIRWATGALSTNPIVRWRQINSLIWSAQACLTMFFAASGYAKVTEPITLLAILLNWPTHVDDSVVRGLGLVEIALAVAVLSPLVSWKWGRPLVRMAALILAILTATMVIVHATIGDVGLAIVNAVLFGLAAFVLHLRGEATRIWHEEQSGTHRNQG